MSATSTGRGARRRPERVTIFFDRSVGKSLPRAIALLPRVSVLHMSEVYSDDGQNIGDEEWLARAGREGWAVFTQDARIWANIGERAAVREHGVRVFCLGLQQASTAQRALCYGRHILPILRRSRRPGPCFWRIYPERIDKLER